MIGCNSPDYFGFYAQGTDKHAYLRSAREVILEYIRLAFIVNFETLIVKEFRLGCIRVTEHFCLTCLLRAFIHIYFRAGCLTLDQPRPV